ncbi:MAG: cytochrome ubiquinol oxidase subunit I [Sulfurihydrogenibium sp.]|nr:MAG: cytochrome ubiquinol oxidase subunit I [Sulfurihydrogenibium sp.]
MDLLLLSRLQFAFTSFFHFIFVPLTIGLSLFIAIIKTINLKKQDPRIDSIARFLMKVFAVNFAAGVASGLTQEFEFGTNWFDYSKFVGDIFGAPLAIEGLMAFFLESTFMGLFLFGEKRISRGMHTFAAWMVALGTTLSALWILIANSWMQTPAGFKIVETEQGIKAVLTDFFEAALNHTTIFRFLHTVDAGYITGGLFAMGVFAYFILKNRHVEASKIGFKYALIFTAITSTLQIIIGDTHGYQVAHYQPLKMAMYEGVWETEKGAPLVLLGVVDQEKQQTQAYIKIPYLLSILSYHDPHAEFKGIKDLVKEYQEKAQAYKQKAAELEAQLATAPADQQEKIKEELAFAKAQAKALDISFKDLPPVGLVFTSFHLMVYLGFFFAFFSLVGLYLLKKNKIFENKAYLWASILSIPLPFLAGNLGWISTEVGRQPWIVQGVLQTKDAVTLHPPENVALTLAVFFVIYTAIFVAFLVSMVKVIKKGLDEKETASEYGYGSATPSATPNVAFFSKTDKE